MNTENWNYFIIWKLEIKIAWKKDCKFPKIALESTCKFRLEFWKSDVWNFGNLHINLLENTLGINYGI